MNENIACEECGRTDLPLHVDYLCPCCSPHSNEDGPMNDDWIVGAYERQSIHRQTTSEMMLEDLRMNN